MTTGADAGHDEPSVPERIVAGTHCSGSTRQPTAWGGWQIQ